MGPTTARPTTHLSRSSTGSPSGTWQEVLVTTPKDAPRDRPKKELMINPDLRIDSSCCKSRKLLTTGLRKHARRPARQGAPGLWGGRPTPRRVRSGRSGHLLGQLRTDRLSQLVRQLHRVWLRCHRRRFNNALGKLRTLELITAATSSSATTVRLSQLAVRFPHRW